MSLSGFCCSCGLFIDKLYRTAIETGSFLVMSATCPQSRSQSRSHAREGGASDLPQLWEPAYLKRPEPDENGLLRWMVSRPRASSCVCTLKRETRSRTPDDFFSVPTPVTRRR